MPTKILLQKQNFKNGLFEKCAAFNQFKIFGFFFLCVRIIFGLPFFVWWDVWPTFFILLLCCIWPVLKTLGYSFIRSFSHSVIFVKLYSFNLFFIFFLQNCLAFLYVFFVKIYYCHYPGLVKRRPSHLIELISTFSRVLQ